MSDPQRVAVVGGGVMGEALLAAVLRSGVPADAVMVAEKSRARADALAATHGVATTAHAPDAVRGADAVIIAVKPDDVAGLLLAIAPVLTGGALVVTVVAGLPIAFYEKRLPPGTPVVRVMPNTPAVIGAGAAGMSAGTAASTGHLTLARRLLEGTGTVLQVPEAKLDAVTAISGSGPAYVFYLVDALAEAGVLLGLPRAQALELAIATFRGSAELLAESGEHPVVLRERVSSPGGTTVAALEQLDAHGARAAVLAAARAARDRSVELAAEAARAEAARGEAARAEDGGGR